MLVLRQPRRWGRRAGRRGATAASGRRWIGVAVGAGVLLSLPGSAGAVVGGEAVARSLYPQVVALAGTCTATLVAPDRLLTAGHCVSHVEPGATTVRFGAPSVRYRVVEIARHPGFHYGTTTFPAEPVRDVGLVRLDRSVVGVAPLAVSRSVVRAGMRLTLVGYGTDDQQRPERFGTPRRARLRVRSVPSCRRLLERAETGQGRQFQGRFMLCTQGDRRSGAHDRGGARVSGCFGDSGAPLLRRGPGGWFVVGVDSWGVACGTRNGDPEVYVRVARERAWITAAEPGWVTERLSAGFTR